MWSLYSLYKRLLLNDCPCLLCFCMLESLTDFRCVSLSHSRCVLSLSLLSLSVFYFIFYLHIIFLFLALLQSLFLSYSVLNGRLPSPLFLVSTVQCTVLEFLILFFRQFLYFPAKTTGFLAKILAAASRSQ